MKTMMRTVLLIAAVLISGVAARAQVLVIAHPGVSADSISKSELHDVFTGAATKLKNGAHVKPVLLKEGPTHAAFVTGDLSLSEVGLLICWRGLVFSGQAAMPRTFDTEAAEAAYVAQTPGAIGYIGTATPHPDVKVLQVR